MPTVKLYLGDCLDILPTLPPQSVEAIITDLPYGTTACSWDSVIPFAPMWEQVKRVLKPRGVFVTTASQPFTSALVMSNLDWFRYCWEWEKDKATGFLDANKKPLNNIEDIPVFSANGHTYNPQMLKGHKHKRGSREPGRGETYGDFSNRKLTESDLFYPNRLINIHTVRDSEHPTQKPVALYEYLILTYTNPGDTVMDFCCGSGTTGVAAVKTGRNAILIEKDPGYFETAQRRIKEAQLQPLLLDINQPTAAD